MTKGKITRDLVARRERFVEERLAGLVPLLEVYREFEAAFGVGRRTAERYARRVYDRWQAEGEATRAAKRAEIERAADLTFRDARAKRDTRTQVAVLTLKAQLHGLNRPDDELELLRAKAATVARPNVTLNVADPAAVDALFRQHFGFAARALPEPDDDPGAAHRAGDVGAVPAAVPAPVDPGDE